LPLSRRPSRFALFAGTSLLVALTGCGSKSTIEKILAITGAWRVSSVNPAASHLPSLSGELTGTATGGVTGILYADSTATCVIPGTRIELSGTATPDNQVTLTGSLAGGALTIHGFLAEDSKSLEAATYTVTGGTCPFAASGPADAQAEASATGN
jgi:hypothetical protein